MRSEPIFHRVRADGRRKRGDSKGHAGAITGCLAGLRCEWSSQRECRVSARCFLAVDQYSLRPHTMTIGSVEWLSNLWSSHSKDPLINPHLPWIHLDIRRPTMADSAPGLGMMALGAKYSSSPRVCFRLNDFLIPRKPARLA